MGGRETRLRWKTNINYYAALSAIRGERGKKKCLMNGQIKCWLMKSTSTAIGTRLHAGNYVSVLDWKQNGKMRIRIILKKLSIMQQKFWVYISTNQKNKRCANRLYGRIRGNKNCLNLSVTRGESEVYYGRIENMEF